VPVRKCYSPTQDLRLLFPTSGHTLLHQIHYRYSFNLGQGWALVVPQAGRVDVGRLTCEEREAVLGAVIQVLPEHHQAPHQQDGKHDGPPQPPVGLQLLHNPLLHRCLGDSWSTLAHVGVLHIPTSAAKGSSAVPCQAIISFGLSGLEWGLNSHTIQAMWLYSGTIARRGMTLAGKHS